MRALLSHRAKLTLLAILLAGIALRVMAISHTDLRGVAGLPLEDDAFYYFALGRNISVGGGPRIDSLHETTGFQPLWGALSIAAHVVSGHGTRTIHLLLLAGTLTGAAACILIYAFVRQIARSDAAGLLAAALWFLSPQSIRHNLNGMETGLAVLCNLAIFYTLYSAVERQTPRWAVITGLACGCGFLARVDTIILSGLAGLILVIFAPAAYTFRDRLRAAALFTAAAVVPILPWILFTALIGRSPLPESGQAVRAIATYLSPVPPPRPLVEAFFNQTAGFLDFYGGWAADFTRQFASQIHTLAFTRLLPFDASAVAGRTRLNPQVFIAGVVLVVSLWLAWSSRSKSLRALYGVFVVWLAALTFAYAVVITGIWFFPRYSLPLAEIFGVLAFAIIFRAAGQWVSHPRIRSGLAALGILYCGATFYAYYDAVRTESLYTWISDARAVPHDGFYDAVAWLNTHAPDARVGMFQSGLLSYYGTQTIINLDGKVNRRAHQAMVGGTMWEYVCAMEIDYVLDWPFMVESLLIARTRPERWQQDNLTPVHIVETERIAPMVIYQVNRVRCP